MTAIFTALFGLLFGILAIGAWIGIALGATAMALAWVFTDIPVTRLLPQHVYNIMTASELVALPLFVMMGEFLFRTRLSRSLFNGLAPWAGLLP
ncbi:MAG: TRAP transporter large permease subunit, partial [Rhodospirillales bacterium]